MADEPDSDPVGADTTGDDTLPPSEATDSDELRDADDDAAVTAPDQWQPAEGSLDDRLAVEEPDVSPAQPARPLDDEVATGRHYGQVGGTPEDGESFFPAD